MSGREGDKIECMNTIVIDTSDETTRFGLFQDDKLADKLEWQAHRELSKTFYLKLDELFERNNLSYQNIDSIIVVRGPGSFTGLRIGIVIVNAFSYALGIETAGVVSTPLSFPPASVIPAKAGISSADKLRRESSVQYKKMELEEIYKEGKKTLKKGQIIEPFYGREPNITTKKKR